MNRKENKGWWGVDLDKTLVQYDFYKGATHIGEPIPLMVNRVKRLLREGCIIKIFTARADPNDLSSKLAIPAIKEWSKKIFGQELEVTNAKDYSMIGFFDDRAIQIIPNTGLRADGLDNDL